AHPGVGLLQGAAIEGQLAQHLARVTGEQQRRRRRPQAGAERALSLDRVLDERPRSCGPLEALLAEVRPVSEELLADGRGRLRHPVELQPGSSQPLRVDGAEGFPIAHEKSPLLALDTASRDRLQEGYGRWGCGDSSGLPGTTRNPGGDRPVWRRRELCK